VSSKTDNFSNYFTAIIQVNLHQLAPSGFCWQDFVGKEKLISAVYESTAVLLEHFLESSGNLFGDICIQPICGHSE